MNKNIIAFEYLVYAGGEESVLMFDLQSTPSHDIKGKYGPNTIIINNSFKFFDTLLLFYWSSDRPFFKNNTIEQPDKYDPIFSISPNLKIINYDRVILGNNTYKSLNNTKGTLSKVKTSNFNLKNYESFMSVN